MEIVTNRQPVFNEIIIDSPKKRISDDQFGWEPIVYRISNAIKLKTGSSHECYTIGIYSKWGEGKTSFMNMVSDHLSSEEKIKIINYNPWLFKDQESLLLDFFKALQTGITTKKVVDIIKKYGPLVSLGVSGVLNIAMPGLGKISKGAFDKVINAVGEIDVDINSLKIELNQSIKDSGDHYLILIDDVDRLDKEELHALFKLIRLNADFVNTTYMIAMDVDMVAKSIGQRFEGGDEQAGKNFLEKIIQVPVYYSNTISNLERNKSDRI